MQASKWLGHSMFTFTLNTYGDWIPEEDGGAANLPPEPPTATTTPSAPQTPESKDARASDVVPQFGRRSAG